MFAMEDSTSSACAREIRGTASTATAVTGRRDVTSTIPWSSAGASWLISVAPDESRSSSAGVGGLTCRTTSAAHASSPPTTVAPAAAYSWSGKLLPCPAPEATATSYPRRRSAVTVVGVAATRVSRGRDSAGTPISTCTPPGRRPTTNGWDERARRAPAASPALRLGSSPRRVRDRPLARGRPRWRQHPQVVSEPERRPRELLEPVAGQPVDQFAHEQPSGRDVEDGQVGVDAVDHPGSGQRVGATLQQLRLAVGRGVGRQHEDATGADGEVHRAAHGGRVVLVVGRPVGEVAVRTDLESAEHRDVQVSAAHDHERVGVVEVRAAGQQRDRFLAGVDELGVLLPRYWCRADAEDPVLAVVDHLAVLGHEVRHQGRQTDAQVDVGPVGDVLGRPSGHVGAAQALDGHRASPRSTQTTRSTNTPGVTTTSGSSSPSSTNWRTCTTVSAAAEAMVGPKFRAAEW